MKALEIIAEYNDRSAERPMRQTAEDAAAQFRLARRAPVGW